MSQQFYSKQNRGQDIMPKITARLLTLCIVTLMLIPALSAFSGGSTRTSEIDRTIVQDQDPIITEPVLNEIISMRTLNSKFFDSGDGTITSRTWIKPIHFQDETGELLDFETELRPLSDNERNGGEYETGVMQNTLRAFFRYDYNSDTGPVKYENRDGSWLSWTPGEQQVINTQPTRTIWTREIASVPVTGVIDSANAPGIIEYRDVYEGVSEKYTVSTGMVKHDYVIDDRSSIEQIVDEIGSTIDVSNTALAFSGKLEFSSGMIPYVDGEPLGYTSGTIKTSSGIVFRSGYSGEVKHYLPAPYAVDERGGYFSTASEYIISDVGKRSMILSVATPLAWLLDPARVYPVVIDPSDDIYTIKPQVSDGKDTFISDGGNEDMNVGADPAVWLSLDSQVAYLRMRPIMYFDISSIPVGKEIIYAKVFLNYYRDINNDPGTMTVSAHRMTHSWTEGTGTTQGISHNGATWNDYDGTNAWNKIGGDYDQSPSTSIDITSYGTYSWDIRDIFESWTIGSYSNTGILMKGTSGVDSVRYLYTTDHTVADQRPYMEIKILTERPPIVIPGAITSLFLWEDSKPFYQDMTLIFSDPNAEDELTYSLWLNGWSTGPFESENMTISVEPNATLMITPIPNVAGTDVIQLSVSDTIFEAYHTLTITIRDVNDPPELRLISDKKGVQGSYLNFSFKAKEEDANQEGTLTFGSDKTDNNGNGIGQFTGDLTIIKSTTNLLSADVSFLPENQHVGEIDIVFSVRDVLGGMDNQSVRFTIKNTNDQPLIKQLLKAGDPAPQVIKNKVVNLPAKQDEYLNFTLIVDDPDQDTPDGEVLEFLSNRSDSNFVIESGTGNISYLPGKYDVGNFYARVHVRDDDGAEDWVDVIIRTRNENDPPEITGIIVNDEFYGATDKVIEFSGENRAWQDEYFNFTVVVVDPDIGFDGKEVLKFWTNRSMDFNLILDTRTGEGTVLFSQADVGIYYLKVWVMDNDEVEDHINITVHVTDLNDVPPLPPLSVVVIDEETLTVRAIVTSFPILDPDGDFLKCIWDFGDGSTPEEKILGSEKWTADHTYLKSGIYEIKLTLDDGRGGIITAIRNTTVGDVTVIVDDDGDQTSLGTQRQGEDINSDLSLITLVVIVVIIVILISLFFYMRAGRRLVEEEEGDEEDLLDFDFAIPELGLFGPEAAQMQTMAGYSMMHPQQLQGYPMQHMQYGQMMPQMPAMPGMQQQLALPPAQMAAFCPQCSNQSLQPSTKQPGKYICTTCGFVN